ncbi:MAG: bifunctional phosphopantothenoylcysteine decarboxylase/phosphopantothenate--cysteine ligase CoaBC [Gammaproteobacteria bacterium]|nr:bifunctional phosphopantothenoylcysteine decarboxylase/phosphopantothenate--cysteine ligase CoaBC [Gammaproteobacteria bacterium]
MQGKRIVLGIGGGIAAYKTPALVRQLVAAGMDVIPVMTGSANHFVTATVLTTLSGHRVRDDLWDLEAERSMGHIELARWADTLLIAPATANVLARLANGLSNDLLTTLYLATTAPTVVAPAMNLEMWNHSATKRNIGVLKTDGVSIIGPDRGEQACGETGPGRMLEIKDIVSYLLGTTDPIDTPMTGLRVLVTAGPTRESIDPVRYITNSSSGKQGYAIAEAARDAGAIVTLVSGPVALPPPKGVQQINIISAAQMKSAVLDIANDIDIMFGVAAVADYRPSHSEPHKIRKMQQNGSSMSIELVENDDILASVAALSDPPYLVGFAAETQSIIKNAVQKRESKCLDAIVVNDVSDHSIGFDSDENEVTLLHAHGETTFDKSPKAEIASKLVAAISELYTSNRT